MAKNIKKKFKPKKERDIAKEELKSLEDLPLVGGLFKGLEKFIDLAEKVEEAGGKIEKKGEIRGKEGKVRGIYGFSIGTLDGRPRIQTFGNIKPVKEKERAKPEFKITETREPIVDVFDEKDHILIVAELPGVDENSITIDLKEDILILKAGDEKKKYYKEILLPSKVKAETKEQSYKNGILEIKFQRESSKNN